MTKKILLFSSCLFFSSPLLANQVISEIKVIGNRFLTSEEVLRYLNLKPGIIYSQDYIYRSVKEAFEKGAFKNIQIFKKEEKGKLILYVRVEDLPVIYDVEFRGNKELDDETLREAIGVPQNPQELIEQQTSYISGPAVEEKLKLKKLVPIGRPLSLEEIEEMKKRIILRYALEGYPNVKVSYKIVPIKGASKLVFYIKEGKPVYVKEIDIKGLKTLDPDDIKDIMELQEPNIFLFRFHPPFSKEILENDIKRIEEFLKSKGFFEGKVVKYEVKKIEPEWVKIIIYIKEGKRYRISKVKIKGNTYFGFQELSAQFLKKLKKNNYYYDAKLIDKWIQGIEEKYKNLGLYWTKVGKKENINYQNKTVEVIALVKESKPVYNRFTEIKGNFETRDYVIRRELEYHEGDLITLDKVKWSKIWLKRLGYYNQVKIKTSPLKGKGIFFQPSFPQKIGSFLIPEWARTTVKVSERFTGQLSLGIGYSETSGLSGFISVKKGNFLGTGDIVSFSYSKGEYYNSLQFSYTRKWFLKKPQDLSISIYNTYHDYDTYNIEYKGFSTTLTRRFWRFYKWSIGLDIQNINYSDISPDASIYVKESAQFNSARLIRWSIVRDTRNDYIFPSEGSFIGLYEKLGGLLGGDEKFTKFLLKGSIYRKDEYFDTDTIFSAKAQLGSIATWLGGDVTPIDERFFVGGDYTIRGYKYGYAGPIDPYTEEPIGANKMFVINLEADYPIAKERFYVAGFFDMGNGANEWNNLFSDIKAGTGFGVRFITPMAPIKLDFAWKLKKVPGDTNNFRIHLVIGSFF